MKSEQATRESQRIDDLASEYTKKGYSVVRPRSNIDVPAFLRSTNYVPDLIVTSGDEKLVIEVKTQETTRDLDRLSSVSELVNAQEGWQFVLVLTNPRERPTPSDDLSVSKIHELLDKSQTMGSKNQAHIEASFLFAWAALEASFRLLPQLQPGTKQISTPWTLIRDATMFGHLDRKDAQALARLFRIRNSLLHAGSEASPTIEDVELVRRVALENIQQEK